MPSEDAFLALIAAIVADDSPAAIAQLTATPQLARHAATFGATRQDAKAHFFDAIMHYMYAGDTALHMAAAGFRADMVQALIDHGADCTARNRRGAQPLHYAADTNRWAPQAQAAVIACLTAAGAPVNATDKSGTTPLHRAVRTRSSPAVEALLKAGADPRTRNGQGSSPLHLAVQTTGRGGSGSPLAIEQQGLIIDLLLGHGASLDETDAHGRAVRALMARGGLAKFL